MAKLSSRALISIALGLSLLTSLLIYSYLKDLSTQTAAKEGVPVVVAKAEIPAKTRITADMVQTVKIPADYIQPGAVTDLAKAVGVVARENIVAGEQITGRLLLLDGKAAGFAGLIPQDKRALTVGVSEVTGVAGFVKAGDRVDVVITFDQGEVGDHASKTVLQNLLVLAADRDTGGSGQPAKTDAPKAGSVTLAVSPDEAAQLALAEEKGKLRLALRSYLSAEGQVAVNAVTPKDLVGVHSSPVQKQDGGDKGGGAAVAPAPAPRNDGGSFHGVQVIRGTKIADSSR